MQLLQQNHLIQLDAQTPQELFEQYMEPVYRNHCQGVAQIADEMTLVLQENHVMLPGNFTKEQLHTAFLLHDIGKTLTPPNILKKEGPLNKEEMIVMRNHVIEGLAALNTANCFRQLNIPYRRLISQVVCCHHERWNGEGYLLGLSGENIPFYARVCAVADAYEAITHDRSYQKGRTRREALEIIQQNAGTQFDAQLLEILFRDTRWAV